jgi:hypothetical protein
MLHRLAIPPIIPISVVRVAISIGTIIACIALGWKLTPTGIGPLKIEMIAGGIVLIVFLILALRHIEFGVFAILLATFFVRFALPTGTNSRIPASMVLAGLMVAVWILGMVFRHEIRLAPTRTNLPLIGFVIVSILSYPWSWLSWRPEFWTWTTPGKFQIAQFGGLALMVLLPATFLMTFNLLRDKKWYTWMVILMAVIALPELAQRLMQKTLFFTGLGIAGPGLFHDWLIAMLYAQLLFNRSLPKWARVFFIVIIISWFFWAFIIQIKWLSGWVPTALAILFLTFIKSKRATILLICLMALPFLFASGYYYETIWLDSQKMDFNRFWMWRVIIFDLTLTKAGILLGAGPAGYAPYFMTYYPGLAMSAHNNYVDIIAETGLIGFFFFLWFLVEVLRSGWRLHSKLDDGLLLGFNNGVLAGFIAILGAMMLDDWFIPLTYNNGLDGFGMTVYGWILIAAMVGLERHVPPPSLHPLTATRHE